MSKRKCCDRCSERIIAMYDMDAMVPIDDNVIKRAIEETVKQCQAKGHYISNES